MNLSKHSISWFVAGGKRMTIQGDPLIVRVEPDGSGLLLSEPVFGLLVPAKNVREGISGIRTQLSMLWDAYLACPESILMKGAGELRRKLMELVKPLIGVLSSRNKMF